MAASAEAPSPLMPVERFRLPLGSFPTLRAMLWVNFLRSLAPSLVFWSGLTALVRGSADLVALGVGVGVSSSLHWAGHYLAGLLIVPGQATRTARVLNFLSGFSLLDRINPGLRPGLAAGATRLLHDEESRAGYGRRLLGTYGGVRVRISVPLATSGADVDAGVFGGSSVPRPSPAFLTRLAASGLGHDSDTAGSSSSSVGEGPASDDDTESLLHRGSGGGSTTGGASFGVAAPPPPRPADDAAGGRARLCVIYLGGNAELWERLRECPRLLARGFAIVAPNYPGVGDSGGHSTVSGLLLTGAACVEFAVAHLGFPRNRIVLFGHSIGGGVACELARHYPECHLLADRTFGRLADVAATIVTRMVAPAAARRLASADAAAAASLSKPASADMRVGGSGPAPAARPAAGPPPPASMTGWAAFLSSPEGWARLLVLFGVGWELDAASAYRALILRERSARERILRAEGLVGPSAPSSSSSSTAASARTASADAVTRAVVESRALRGLGRRLLLFSPADAVIPLRVSLPFTLGCDSTRLIPPGEGIGLTPLGRDEHNRDFALPEWRQVSDFLDRCAVHL